MMNLYIKACMKQFEFQNRGLGFFGGRGRNYMNQRGFAWKSNQRLTFSPGKLFVHGSMMSKKNTLQVTKGWWPILCGTDLFCLATARTMHDTWESVLTTALHSFYFWVWATEHFLRKGNFLGVWKKQVPGEELISRSLLSFLSSLLYIPPRSWGKKCPFA